MRKLLLTLVLLLLLPLAMGINVQADETEPPIDPGGSEDGGDITGDHPWGGEERVIITQDDNDTRDDLIIRYSFDKYLKTFVYAYFGLDFFDRPDQEYYRTGTATEFKARTLYTYRSDSEKRSR